MNKIVCPHCNKTCVMNNKVKACSDIKCPCCGKMINLNNCCCDNKVYLLLETDTKECISVFKKREDAFKYIETIDRPFLIQEMEIK